MLEYLTSNALRSALSHHTACIYFSSEGIIQEASEPFLTMMGYSLSDIKGKHHRIFCLPEETSTHQYMAFWTSLAASESQQGRFRRVNALGEEVWLEATYLPIKNRRGNVVQILKVATDVTKEHQNAASERFILQALNSSMAVIEFTTDGFILDANTNFEQVMGYPLHKLRGEHHRLFCDNDFYREHSDFWQRLSQG